MQKMWKWCCWCLVGLVLVSSVSSIIITEIMSNPIDDESLNEWIEIYNDDSEAVNLSGWSIRDEKDEDFLIGGFYGGKGVVISGYGYGIITDEMTRVYNNFNVSSNVVKLYVDDGAIGNGLKNSGECLSLYSDSKIDEVCYEETNDGYSYGLLDGWEELLPTPGYDNNGSESLSDFCDFSISILLEDNFQASWKVLVNKEKGDGATLDVIGYVENIDGEIIKEYKPFTDVSVKNHRSRSYNPKLDYGVYLLKYEISSLDCDDDNLDNNYAKELIVLQPEPLEEEYFLEITEFLPDPEGDDNALMPEGEFIEIFNEGDAVDLDGFVLKDSSGHSLIISDVRTLDGTIIDDYLVVYTNGRSGFLNNDGYEEIKLYYNDNLIDSVSYGDSVEGTSYSKVDGEWKLSVPSPGFSNSVGDKKSSIEIIKIDDLGSDEKAKYGQIIRAKLGIYKGDTSKNLVKVWAEDKNGEKISKQSKVMVYSKYHNYSFTVPLQLKPNCKGKLSEGSGILFVEGLEDKEEIEFEIEGNEEENCEKVIVDKATVKKKFDYSIISKPSIVKIDEEFTTKVRLENNDDSDVDIEIWSYVYSGNKCYSGEREGNMQKFSLEANSSIEVDLVNKVDMGGDFNFKVKIRKDNQKTTKDITDRIGVLDEICKHSETVEELSIAENEVKMLESQINYSEVLPEIKGMVVYESSSEKARRMIPSLFIGILLLLCVFLLVRKL